MFQFHTSTKSTHVISLCNYLRKVLSPFLVQYIHTCTNCEVEDKLLILHEEVNSGAKG